MSLKKYKLEQSLSLSIHSVDKMMQCSAKKSRIKGCPCCEEIFIGREIKATTEIMLKLSGCVQRLSCHIYRCLYGRSISAYKLILTEKYHKLTPQNIEKYIVTYCKTNCSQENE
jgi:hypothetical protein